jgi:hypothetical protein
VHIVKNIKVALMLVMLTVIGLTVSACGENAASKAHESEAGTRGRSYERLANRQPAHEMDYSPTRSTINFWIDKWGHSPNKLSYVYLQAANGELEGYYVFKGLPVSYCAAITENYEFVDPKNDGEEKDFQVPAPGVDGAYYSGGQCNAYYGQDASTGAFIEFTVGGSQNYLLYDRPLPRPNVEPLGFTTIEEAKKIEKK